MRLLTVSRRPRGIALMLTLVVLLLLTIFITEFFFETTLETRAIQNFNSSFLAQSVAKSMFKAMLVALTLNETEFFRNLTDLYAVAGIQIDSWANPPAELIAFPEGIIPDFDNAIFYTPYVRSIDHLYNLNRLQSKSESRRADGPEDRPLFNQFVNLMLQVPVPLNPEGSTQEGDSEDVEYLPLEKITPLYAAIFDWIDGKDEDRIYQNQAGVRGFESGTYVGFEVDPDLQMKNRKIDRLTEIRLIEGVVDSGIPFDTWQKYFTVYPVGKDPGVGEAVSRLNVNIASRDDIIEFLRRFDQDSAYYSELNIPDEEKNFQLQPWVFNAEAIADVLVTEDLEGQRINYKDLNAVDAAVRGLNLERGRASDFFIVFGEWYEIRLIAEVQEIQAEIRAIVRIGRDPNSGAGKPDEVEIVDFIMR